jgi:hypothetical protein
VESSGVPFDLIFMGMYSSTIPSNLIH